MALSNVISAYRDQLNHEGHDLLDALKPHFPEWKIRASLSRHLGMPYSRHNPDTGFHFSKHEPIDRVERAVVWLRRACEQQSLSPRMREWPYDDVMLPQDRMKEALQGLKHHP